MPGFFSRRYMRKVEQVSGTEKVVGAFILMLLAAVVAAFFAQVATNDDYLFTADESAYLTGGQAEGISSVGTDSPFPPPDIEEWRAPRRVSRYAPDKLYLKINGRADIYLEFNVEGLTFGSYYDRRESGRTVDVYWYEMGEPADGRGIYELEAPPGVVPLAVGSDGYEVGGAIFFRRDVYYVQVLPAGRDASYAPVALAIARRIDEQIERLILTRGKESGE